MLPGQGGGLVPDFLLRGIDPPLAEQIKTVARDRKIPLNDAIIDLIRRGLAVSYGDAAAPVDAAAPAEPRDIAHLAGTWAPDEAAAFRAAMEALQGIPPGDEIAARSRKG
jgi:hypothetical protein